jgi:hypothetical protein
VALRAGCCRRLLVDQAARSLSSQESKTVDGATVENTSKSIAFPAQTCVVSVLTKGDDAFGVFRKLAGEPAPRMKTGWGECDAKEASAADEGLTKD